MNRIKIFSLIMAVLFLLTACSEEYTPVPTPTLIPLSEINLKDLILIPSIEMPQGFIASKTKDSLPNLDIPEPLKLIWQQIETENDVAGGVRIYLYESKLDMKEAYLDEVKIIKSLSTNVREISEVGEYATISYYKTDQDTITDLVFYRCYATVVIRLININSENIIIEYAKKLDSNINRFICR